MSAEAAQEPRLRQLSVEELHYDEKNANVGTDRGRDAVHNSIVENKFGRSILIDKDGKIIGGNKSVAAAIKAGLKTVRVIETTGDEIIAVQRTDIDLESPEGRRLAIAENRTAELGLQWDPAVLSELTEAGVDVSSYFTETELSKLCESLTEEMMDFEDDAEDSEDDITGESTKMFNVFIEESKYQEFVDAVEFLREKQNYESASDMILDLVMRSYSAG